VGLVGRVGLVGWHHVASSYLPDLPHPPYLPHLPGVQSNRRSKPDDRRRASAGGKSELRRTVRRVTPGQGDLKDSGTENIPPVTAGLKTRATPVLTRSEKPVR